MASRSSQRKSGSKSSREDIVLLLQDGAIIQEPREALLQAAEHLEKSGIVKTRLQEYVSCADPQDADFPPKNRNCRGKIYLDETMDEAGHDFRCPDCDRPVFPFRSRKKRHKELQTSVSCQGVKSYVLAELAKLKSNVKEVAEAVYRIDLGEMGVLVCIADFCGEERFLSRDQARIQPTCYVLVNSKVIEERFLQEEWLRRVSLADVVSGHLDFGAFLGEVAASPSPQTMLNASISVYTKGALPIVAEPVAPPNQGRRFVVEIDSKVVRVEGEVVVAPQAGTRFYLFQLLWEQFLEDLKEGLGPADYHPLNVEDLTEELQKKTGKDIKDLLTIRRSINHLQEDIETAVRKKIGLPIDREDIIQTCRWKGQGEGEFGYRLNPFTVAVRPFQAQPK